MFLSEKFYEWHSEESTGKGLWCGIPRKWRLYWEENQHGPFFGWKVFIHLKSLSGPPQSLFEDVIRAGSGIVADSLDKNTSFAIVDDDAKAESDKITSNISKMGIKAVSGSFILDFFTLKYTPKIDAYKLF